MAITKMAIDRAESVMNDEIKKRVIAWQKKNPAKAKVLTAEECAKIAIKDPAWLALVIKRAAQRYGTSMGLDISQLSSDSPMVWAAIKAAESVDDWRKDAMEKMLGELNAKRDKIITEASMGVLEPSALLDRCNAF